jgi:hypothetical protein
MINLVVLMACSTGAHQQAGQSRVMPLADLCPESCPKTLPETPRYREFFERSSCRSVNLSENIAVKDRIFGSIPLTVPAMRIAITMIGAVIHFTDFDQLPF